MNLSQQLAEALMKRTSECGSTLYSMTWKEHTTPAGRLLFRLAASALRISGKGSTGWPTPTAKTKAGGEYRDPEKAKARALGPHANDLRDFAQLAGWSTASSRDWKDTPGMTAQRKDGRSRLDQLPRQAHLTGWPTPMAGTPAQNGNNEAGNNDSSRKTVELAGWATPAAQEFEIADPERMRARRAEVKAKGINGNGFGLSLGMQTVSELRNSPGPARLTASGEMLIGSAARMASGGQLSPRHSLWLMIGPFAEAWMLAGMRVKKKAKRSSGTSRSRKQEVSPTE